MDALNLLSTIIVFVLIGSTFQLAVIKNNIDRKWNDRFGAMLGNYCFLCVAFWTNLLFVSCVALWMNTALTINGLQLVLIIFAVPAGVTYLLNKINHGN